MRLEQLFRHQLLILGLERVVVGIGGREQAAQPRVIGAEQVAQLAGQLAQYVTLFGRDGDDEVALAGAADRPPVDHPSLCCIVAHSPCSWRRNTSSSARSRPPLDTMALPF